MMNKKLITVTAMTIMVAGCIPATTQAATLSRTTITLTEGQAVKLKVSGTKKSITWKTTNKKIAKVSKKGKVTAITAGKCKIKAKFGKKTLKCKVTVEHDYKATTIKLPTCTETGLVRWTCKCGATFDEVTQPGHDYVNGKCVECGKEE